MSVRGWLRARQQLRRLRKVERSERGPLREFVYLDEVSVYSLMASQVGLIVTELTDTQATSLQSEISSGLGVSAPFKAEIGSKLQGAESRSSQVLRKAIIQTTFRDLRESAERSGALRLVATTERPPALSSLDEIARHGRDCTGSPWVIPHESLRRGDLVELDVQLEAEPIYQAEAVMSGLLEIIQDDPAAFGLTDLGALAEARLVSRILDKVLAGLVPLRGRAFNYDAIDVDGENWLIHSNVSVQLGAAAAVTPVFLVGVAQEGLFWKDVRRVLFSGSCYRALARLNTDGLRSTWTPVKLVDVLRDVVPDFADVMETMNKGVLASMSSAVAAQQAVTASDRLHAVTTEYASLLADRTGIELGDGDLVRTELASVGTGATPSIRDIRRALAPVTKLFEDRSGTAIPREIAADYRIAAITRAGLLDPATPAAAAFAIADQVNPGLFLDSEIVAVYW